MRHYLDLMDRLSRSREVETVRLFTSSGHPWMGLTALMSYRLPFVIAATVLVVRYLPF